ncbi:uncharacterized protein LOC142234491 isoform X2 [Haematobia irritans]|uniref:uncharacterized protein LOC142234452 isoform X2 n=1 Tax=Haematobia irritans TaxID=7368 RepID=UPI003F4FD216
MSFWSFWKQKPEEEKNILKSYKKEGENKSPTFPILMDYNFPKNLQEKISITQPYVFTSFIAWPCYWIYRGLEWNNQSQRLKLPVYIHKTYLHAKFIQVGIILTGLAVASMEPLRNSGIFQRNSGIHIKKI